MLAGEGWLPEGSRGVEVVAVALLRGEVILGSAASAGPWTPAVPDGFDWAVLGLRGEPLYLFRDAYEAAVCFASYLRGQWAPVGEDEEARVYPMRQLPDAYLAAERQWEKWFYELRFNEYLGGERGYEPPAPRLADYEANERRDRT